MDQQELRDIMGSVRNDAKAALLRTLTAALAGPYAALMRMRRQGYRQHPSKSISVGVPVISVGNITTGGTGKTPMVAWLVEQLAASGRKPAVVTRGYMTSGQASDEAQLLRQGESGPVKVFVDPDRVAAARAAVADGADVIVMDDGFQHRRLRRDLDIVLIDAINPFGFGHCLPRGLLREPLSALADADVLVITHSDLIEPVELSGLQRKLAELAPRAMIALAEHEPTTVRDPDNEEFDAHLLDGLVVCAFCGLGNPDAFFRTLKKLGCQMVATIPFDDHAAYNAVQIDRIMNAVASSHAQVLVTTAKDKVKILPAQSLPLPLLVLNMRMKLSQGQAELWNKVEKVLMGHKA